MNNSDFQQGGFLDILTHPFKNYANFFGRTRRLYFWGFTVLQPIIIISMIFATSSIDRAYDTKIGYNIGYFFFIIYTLIAIIPNISLNIRRLHDANYSGYFVLLVLIPIVGPFILILMHLLPSSDGENKWGLNPKGEGNNSDNAEEIIIE